MSSSTPYLPTEIWDIIFDYKNAMETKEKHNALTKDLCKELNKRAMPKADCGTFDQEFHHVQECVEMRKGSLWDNWDAFWWMVDDGSKDVDHHAQE